MSTRPAHRNAVRVNALHDMLDDMLRDILHDMGNSPEVGPYDLT